MKFIQLFLFLALLTVLLTQCVSKKEEWTGYYYRDISKMGDETTWIISESKFSSLEECRDWVDYTIRSRNDKNYDYECGLNCEFKAKYGTNVCKETKQ